MLKQIGDEVTAILLRKTVTSLPSAAVRFDKNYEMINLSGTAFTGSLSTLNFTDAQVGATFSVYKHNDSTNPLASIPAANVYNQLGTYQLNQDNYIVFQYVGMNGADHRVSILVTTNIDWLTLINAKENIVGDNELQKGMLVDGTTYYNLLGPIQSATSTSVGFPSGSLRAHPFQMTQAANINSFQVEVVTSQVGGLGRFGIYNSANNYPTSLVANSEFEIDCSSTGFKTATPSSPVVLPRGSYFLAHNGNNSGIVIRSVATTVNRTLGCGNNGSGVMVLFTNYSYALAYGALPASYAGGANKGNLGYPIVAARLV